METSDKVELYTKRSGKAPEAAAKAAVAKAPPAAVAAAAPGGRKAPKHFNPLPDEDDKERGSDGSDDSSDIYRSDIRAAVRREKEKQRVARVVEEQQQRALAAERVIKKQQEQQERIANKEQQQTGSPSAEAPPAAAKMMVYIRYNPDPSPHAVEVDSLATIGALIDADRNKPEGLIVIRYQGQPLSRSDSLADSGVGAESELQGVSISLGTCPLERCRQRSKRLELNLENADEEEVVYNVHRKCNHLFHRGCLENHLDYHYRDQHLCPQCGKDYEGSSLRKLLLKLDPSYDLSKFQGRNELPEGFFDDAKVLPHLPAQPAVRPNAVPESDSEDDEDWRRAGL